MKFMTTVTGVVIGAACLFALTPPAQAAERTCFSKTYIHTRTVHSAGRMARLWQCEGQPYFHAQLSFAYPGDVVWVHNVTKKTFFSASAYAGRTSVSTRALVLSDGQRVRVCTLPASASRLACSKDFLFRVSRQGRTPTSIVSSR